MLHSTASAPFPSALPFYDNYDSLEAHVAGLFCLRWTKNESIISKDCRQRTGDSRSAYALQILRKATQYIAEEKIIWLDNRAVTYLLSSKHCD
jgi:hypothetical protein